MAKISLLRIAARLVIADTKTQPGKADEKPSQRAPHHKIVEVMKKWAQDNKALLKSDPDAYVDAMAEELDKYGWDRTEYLTKFRNSPLSILNIVDDDMKKILLNSSVDMNRKRVYIGSTLVRVGFSNKEAASFINSKSFVVSVITAAKKVNVKCSVPSCQKSGKLTVEEKSTLDEDGYPWMCAKHDEERTFKENAK